VAGPDTDDPPPPRSQQPLEAEDDELARLRPFGLPERFAPGAMLFRQGERPQRLYVIEHGEVALWDESRPQRRLVQVVHAGASVGDLPVLLGQPSLYTAVARVETQTLAFSRGMVDDLLELDPKICFLWFRLLARRLDSGYQRNIALAGRSALERLGRFLLQELQAGGDARVELTQAELASALGLSRQRVSRVLGALERLGVLEQERGGIHVLAPDRLRALLPR
jgi:CRP-like cAMP-binding protein